MHDPDSTRNGTVEYLRFIAAAAIIWFHLGLPFSSLALSALPLFLVLQIMFSPQREASHHIHRLLVPWLAWSGFFAVSKILQAQAEGTPLSAEFAPWMLLTGPAIHLWYLPFSLVAVLCVLALRRWLTPRGMTWLAGAVGLLALGLFNTVALPTPLAQWVSVIPGVCCAAYVLACRDTDTGPVPALLHASAFCAVAVFALGWTNAGVQTMLATLCLAGALSLRLPNTTFAATLGGMSFGIYLLHPAVYAVLKMALVLPPLEMFCATLAGSMLGIWLLNGICLRAQALWQAVRAGQSTPKPLHSPHDNPTRRNPRYDLSRTVERSASGFAEARVERRDEPGRFLQIDRRL